MRNARKLGLLSGKEQGAGGKSREYSRKKTNGFNSFNFFNFFNFKKLSECET